MVERAWGDDRGYCGGAIVTEAEQQWLLCNRYDGGGFESCGNCRLAQGGVETVSENVLEPLCSLLQKPLRDIVWVCSFLSANTVECFLNVKAVHWAGWCHLKRPVGVWYGLAGSNYPSTDTTLSLCFCLCSHHWQCIHLYRLKPLRQMMGWSEEVMQSHESPLLVNIPTRKTPACLMLGRLSAVLVPNKHTGRHRRTQWCRCGWNKRHTTLSRKEDHCIFKYQYSKSFGKISDHTLKDTEA